MVCQRAILCACAILCAPTVAAADSAAASKGTLVALDECVAAQVAQLARLLAVVLETFSGLAALPRHSPNLVDIHQVHVQLQ